MSQTLSILVVGPHPDDQELGMGGTVAKLAAQGHRVTLLDMTDGEPTPMGNSELRAREAIAAAAALAPENGSGETITRVNLGLKNRFVEHSLEARHRAAGVMRAVQAQVIFTPYFEDAHPDHLATTKIIEDARFDAKLTKLSMPDDGGHPPIYPKWLFYYFATHLRIVPNPSFFVDTSGFEARKRASILAYHSQFVANTKNAHIPDWVASADRYFGSRIGTNAAEAFFTREPIGLGCLDSLVM